LPPELQPIQKLAYNLWISWNQDTRRLFQHIDRDLWDESGHNPVEILSRISQGRVMELLDDDGFLSQMERVWKDYQDYMAEKGAYSFLLSQPIDFKIAYFSMEYGLTESLPIYSGGLGVLAGDHLKSASDLRLPLVGVGLMYKQGYFNQYLSSDGWQQENYAENDLYHLPIELAVLPSGEPVKISVRLLDRDCWAQIWKAQVGRVPLYLLDTNIAENAPAERDLTSGLYAGNNETRLRQEILLGIGGVRALKALGEDPIVYHMNEGHCFLVALERIRQFVLDKKLDFETARTVVKSSIVFTTHTPVPAGNDVFPMDLAESYLRPYVDEMGVKWSDFVQLGRARPRDTHEPFGATVFAIKNSNFRNGVSKLHGEVSREMWSDIWPHVNPDESPIASITNGIHIPSWISPEMSDLFDRYLGPRWREDPDNQKTWERINEIPDAELWTTHQRRRSRMVAYCRKRLITQLEKRGAKPQQIDRARESLHPDYLTIGFARRFATYKRGDLIFKNLDRLRTIFNDKDRPVQIIIAGKAHPKDNEGKEIIQRILHIADEAPFRGRIVFIEDYNMDIARYLVEGVDVWLNNPRRPMEACGTSGMKSTANGALNLSVPDGWWVEGYRPELGWSIGAGESYDNLDYQDLVESTAIYDLLEREIIPLFYDRGLDGMPRGWVAMMKKSMRALCPVFNSNRMVEEYTDKCYMEAALDYRSLVSSDYQNARDVMNWKSNLRKSWERIQIIEMNQDLDEEVRVHDEMRIRAKVQLGELKPNEVSVRVYYGYLTSSGTLLQTSDVFMEHMEDQGSGVHVFGATLQCERTGRFGYSVRILPRHRYNRYPLDLGLICWA